jgi:ATP-dependent RNA helicase DDX55/SPB4
LNLKALEVLVLDEADTLLDLGFQATINQILAMLPKQRRTGLFSATQTKEVKELARAGMRNPVSVTVRVQSSQAQEQRVGMVSTPTTLMNWYTVTEYNDRTEALVRFLNEHRSEKVIIFVSTCACVDYFAAVFGRLVKEEV